MSVIILSGDEQKAQDICNEWLQKPALYKSYIAEYEISPVPLKGPPCTWLSVRCKPTKAESTRAITIMGVCLLVCLLLILLLPALMVWGGKLTATRTPSIIFLFSLILVLPFLITLLSPLYTLGSMYRLCRREEGSIIALFPQHEVEYNVLSTSDHYTWFRNDDLLIMLGFLGIVAIRVFTAFNINIWNVLQLVTPVLPILLVFFIIVTLRTIMYAPLKKVSHLPLFWKIKVTALADVSDIFYFLIIFYIFLMIIGHMSLFILILPDGMLQNNSISEIFTALTTFFSDSWILKSIKDLGLDNFTMRWANGDARFHAFMYAEWAVGAVAFLGYLSLIPSIFSTKLWEILEWRPGALPEHIAFQTTHPIVHGALLLEWLVNGLIVRIAGVVIGLGCLLVIFLPSEMVLGEWSIPFLWYQASFQIILGIVVGRTIANALLLLAIAPLLLWLLLWLISLSRDCKQFLSLIFSRYRKSNEKVQTVMNDFCKNLHIRQPLIIFEQRSSDWPSTSFFLPFSMFSVIHLSTEFVEELDQDQLRLVLAHELGHVTKHAWKVWLVQLLSRLSLTGPGFLTLFLDYWKMELEADVFAIQITGDSRGLITLLEKKGEIDVTIGSNIKKQLLQQPAERKRGVQIAKNLRSRLMQRTWINQLIKTYNIHFGYTFWGVLHPPEEERIKNIYNVVFARENLGSLTRFTDQAKQVIEHAREEVKRFGHLEVRTLHLLLGLLHIDFAIDIAGQLAMSSHGLLSAIEDDTAYGNGTTPDMIDFSAFAKRAIVRAVYEADSWKQRNISPEHLLLGLMQEQNTAVDILENRGVDLKKIHIAILEKLDQQGTKTYEAPPRTFMQHEEEAEIRKDENIVNITQHIKKEKQVDKYIAMIPQFKVTTILSMIYPVWKEEYPSQQYSLILRIVLLVKLAFFMLIYKFTHKSESGEEKDPQEFNKIWELTYEEAGYFQHNYIGTEHMLLGLLRDTNGGAARVLGQFDIGIGRGRSAVEFAVGRGEKSDPFVEASDSEAAQALKLAAEEVFFLDSPLIGTEHILLGLLKSKNTASSILESCGVDLEEMREATLALLREKKAPKGSSSDRALANGKNNITDWNDKGNVLYEMGKLQEAHQAFQEAITHNPASVPALYGMGNVLYAQRKFKSAQESYERAVECDPHFVRAWNKLGNLMNDMEHYNRALECYDRALHTDPRFAAALNGKATVLCHIERYAEALEVYEQALCLNPDVAMVWNGKGTAFYQLGNYEMALDAYEHALQLNLHLTTAWHNKSLVLNRIHRYDEALQAAEEAIRLCPDDPDNWLRKAKALKKLIRPEEELIARTEAIRLQQRDQLQFMCMPNNLNVSLEKEKKIGKRQNMVGNTGETTTSGDLTESDIFSPNSRLQQGRYVDMKFLRQGGMGVSALAIDTHASNKQVVIWELVSEDTDPVQGRADVRNFEMEAKSLTRMDHPLIPKVIDYCQEGSHYYLVQEYVEGESLEDCMERLNQPLSEREALIYTSQILDILDYLSKQKPPIVHRDIKPSHIVIGSKDKRAHLVDFSIACLVEEKRAESRQTLALGTPGFAPPEQYQGNADGRSDMYALAAMMHHLLTNRDPRGYAPFIYPPVRSLNQKLTPNIERVLEKALSIRVNQRYQSALKMKQVINKILTHRFTIPDEHGH